MEKDKKTTTNWDRCCLCQTITEEKLVQPSPKTAHLVSGYKTLAENIPKFHELHFQYHLILVGLMMVVE